MLGRVRELVRIVTWPWLAPLAARLAPARERLARTPRRLLVLGGVAAILLVTAVFVWAWSGPEDAPPDDAFVGFYCPACQSAFQLSEREFERVYDRREFTHGGAQHALQIACRRCGKMTAVRGDGPARQRPASGPPRAPAPR